jgi:hypothetical protein
MVHSAKATRKSSTTREAKCAFAVFASILPQLNPIELCFGQLKKWIQRHANLVFPLDPKQVLEVAMRLCTAKTSPAAGFFRHCGYANDALRDQVFEELMASGWNKTKEERIFVLCKIYIVLPQYTAV